MDNQIFLIEFQTVFLPDEIFKAVFQGGDYLAFGGSCDGFFPSDYWWNYSVD